jgi:hypothetical protein
MEVESANGAENRVRLLRRVTKRSRGERQSRKRASRDRLQLIGVADASSITTSTSSQNRNS